MIRAVLWAWVILGALLLLQSTALSYLVVFGVKPDLLWVTFAILAAINGSMTSQVVGFVLGIAVDLVTGGPLGFHAFLFTLAGYLFGLGSGKVFMDPIIVPAVLGLLASLFSLAGGALLTGVFRLGNPLSAVLQWGTLLQVIMNLLLGPAVFWLYGWARDKFTDPRRGFGA